MARRYDSSPSSTRISELSGAYGRSALSTELPPPHPTSAREARVAIKPYFIAFLSCGRSKSDFADKPRDRRGRSRQARLLRHPRQADRCFARLRRRVVSAAAPDIQAFIQTRSNTPNLPARRRSESRGIFYLLTRLQVAGHAARMHPSREMNDPVARTTPRRRARPSPGRSRVSRPGAVPRGRKAIPGPEVSPHARSRMRGSAGRTRFPRRTRRCGAPGHRPLFPVDSPPKLPERRAVAVPPTGEDPYRTMAGFGMRPFRVADTGPHAV